MEGMVMNKKEQSAAIEKLREKFKAGDTVCTVLRHVSRSGMSSSISVLDKDNSDISYLVARALGSTIDQKNGGVKVTGCGMDMGFEIVYNMSYWMYRDGFGCTGEGCPSNDHSNGDRDYTPHVDDCPQNSAEVGTDIPAKRAHSHYHKDGGYALRQRWI
jgi:hypothetical protein